MKYAHMLAVSYGSMYNCHEEHLGIHSESTWFRTLQEQEDLTHVQRRKMQCHQSGGEQEGITLRKKKKSQKWKPRNLRLNSSLHVFPEASFATAVIELFVCNFVSKNSQSET